MELFERVRHLIVFHELSEARMAEALGCHPRTFNGYMNSDRQDNLWPILPKILDVFPSANKAWLYFEEGEMIGASSPKDLTEEEKTLLTYYRAAPGAGRAAILSVSAAIAHPPPKVF